MKLSVVIVSYNVKYYLEQCLISLRCAKRGMEMEVFVVDNASIDGTADYITKRFPEVHYIQNKENLGFSKANNIAIRQATGKYVLLLNPDTIVGENTLNDCVTFLDSHPEAGATGVGMLKDNGGFAWESRRGLPTLLTAFCKLSGLCSLFPKSRIFGKYYMRYLDINIANEIEVISGAFNMIRKSALDKIGLLDEDFFMYGEDIDLSYRLLEGGYKNYYYPTRILHYKGESTHKSSFRYVHVFYNAMLIFFDKHYKKSYRLLSPLIRLAVVMRGGLDYCLRQRDKLMLLLGIRRDSEADKSYLFLGCSESIEQACKLAVYNKIRMDFKVADAHKIPDGHLSSELASGVYDYVVYDTSVYSYEQIFSIMERSSRINKVRLATFSPDTGKLITLNAIY